MRPAAPRPWRAATRAALLAVFVAASAAAVPAMAGEEATPPADRLAGWQTIPAIELADQAGGAGSFSVAVGDLLVNQSDIAATVGQTTTTNVNSGGIGNTTIAGLDGLSTVVFNTGSAVSTAISYQLNVVVK